MIDPKFTAKLQRWLDTPKGKRDVVAGATMLLQLNRNRALFNSIIRRPEKFADKLEYEVRKFLQIRVDNKTIADIRRMSEEVLPSVQEIVETMPMCVVEEEQDRDEPVLSADDELPKPKKMLGRRPDHDQLPSEIRALWDNNAELYQKIKLHYNECCALTDAGAQPCDMYASLKALADADKRYRDNLEKYDSYDLSAAFAIQPELTPAEVANKIGNARKLMSTYRKKFAASQSDDDRKAVIAKLQDCVNIVKGFGGEFAPDTIAELELMGVIFPTNAESRQPQQPEADS